MKVAIIGLGLIGGSFALEMKRLKHSVVGLDKSEDHGRRALEMEIVDEFAECIPKDAELIVLATPVKAIKEDLPGILDSIGSNQMVIDLGSTKKRITEMVSEHHNRGHYLACHPMAGTEFSGPEAAVKNLFRDRFMVICEKEKTDKEILSRLEQLFLSMGMELIYYDPKAHDKHAAYVSHISHVTSFALANTVLEKEENEEDIFKLAAGGFTSTVRLAKSNAETWSEIFLENRLELLDVLKEHIRQLESFHSAIEEKNEEELIGMMISANQIRKIV